MYKGIEGLRAWLAWTVVISHVALLSGAAAKSGIASKIGDAGHYAVLVFIIISGFVITHLIVTKSEPYGIYILRRALRIYPLYAFALCLGVLVAPLAFQAFTDYAFTIELQRHHQLVQAQEYSQRFWPHLLANIFLVQGMIPNWVMDESQYMFIGQAWSLSLEWQFYLVAPFVIAALSNRRTALAMVILALAAYIVYLKFFVTGFYNPSLLLGAGPYFLVGIGTRLAIERMPTLKRYPLEVVVGSFALYFPAHDLVALSVWVAVVCYLRWDGSFAPIDGKLANVAGLRSYSVYLIHEPVMVLVLWLLISIFKTPLWITISAGTIGTVIGTIALAEICYRTIERPGIQFGRRLGRQKTPSHITV